LEQVQGLEAEAIKKLVLEKARQAYAEREIEYPVMVGLYHFTVQDQGGQKRYDREALADWAHTRFNVEFDVESLRNLQRDQVRDLLIDKSRAVQAEAEKKLAELRSAIGDALGVSSRATPGTPENLEACRKLTAWVNQQVGVELNAEELDDLDHDKLVSRLETVVEDKYRPEIRRMERSLVLQLLDTAWKDHLLAMDHLRSSVGLRGYAQVDPKVEYKKEGMRTYELMWTSVGERVTDLIFRMEQLDEGFVGSTWIDSQATHESRESTGVQVGMDDDQQQAIENSEASGAKPEPIRNMEPTVGRNDPCPCGSGKKYKNCHMRKGGQKLA
jgi:preprotein translocase subunit SecA